MSIPFRRCVACRRSETKRSLVRLVVAGNAIVVDPEARRPGRGAYLCGREECLDTAFRRDGAQLIRALRVAPSGITVDEDGIRAGWRAALAQRRRQEMAAATGRPGSDV